eukprot:14665905-Alexandrium_andersonii.AAC.1
MSASLVGSEMCIRDSVLPPGALQDLEDLRLGPRAGDATGLPGRRGQGRRGPSTDLGRDEQAKGGAAAPPEG